MRSEEEVITMINEINSMLDVLQKQIEEFDLKNLSNAFNKKELFLQEGLPLLMALNLLADRQATLHWALENCPETSSKLNKLSKKTFDTIRENLEIFSRQI